jgi:hypothetical protein
MSTRPERRRTIRIRVDGRLVVASESLANPMTLQDVGMGGFSVTSPVQLPVNVVGLYRFGTPDGAWSARFAARIVYCIRQPASDGPPVFHVGLTFVQADADATEQNLMAMMDHATMLSIS